MEGTGSFSSTLAITTGLILKLHNEVFRLIFCLLLATDATPSMRRLDAAGEIKLSEAALLRLSAWEARRPSLPTHPKRAAHGSFWVGFPRERRLPRPSPKQALLTDSRTPPGTSCAKRCWK